MTYSLEYQKQLQAEHNDSKWGSTGARYGGADVLRLLYERPYIRTVLDFGAGKGELGNYILNQGMDVKWTNYDPGMPEYDQLPNGPFDLVITTDMLEHVEPHKLKEVIETLSRLTKTVMYNNIACYLTGKTFGAGPYLGEDLHLIVEDPVWWREQFVIHSDLQLFEWHHVWRRHKGRNRDRCIMVHERV